jgi:hydrogenase maturation protease
VTDGAVHHAAPDDRDTRAPVLVIGVGSELRRDDAAGRRVAEAIDTLELPGVRCLSVHQLTPELAMEIADRRLVIIADASVVGRGTAEMEPGEPGVRVGEHAAGTPSGDEVVVSTVVADDAAGVMSHHLDAQGLLGLAGMVASAPQQVRTVAVPAHDLAIGTELSAGTDAHVREAVRRVVDLCAEVGRR